MLQRCNRSAYRGALHPRLLDKPSCGHPSFTGFHLFFFFKHCDDGGRCLGVHKETARSFYVLQMSPLAFGNRFLRALGAFRRLDPLQPCDDTQHDPLGIVLKKTVPVRKIALRICKVAHSARLHIERANRRHKIFYLRAERSRIAAHRAPDGAGNPRELPPPAVSLRTERSYELKEVRARPRINNAIRKTIEIADDADDERVAPCAGHEHIAAARKHHEPQILLLRPLHSVANIFILADLDQVSRRTSYLKRCERCKRYVFFDVLHGLPSGIVRWRYAHFTARRRAQTDSTRLTTSSGRSVTFTTNSSAPSSLPFALSASSPRFERITTGIAAVFGSVFTLRRSSKP